MANRDLARLCASDPIFVLGPRLNAACRLDDMSGVVVLLLTDDLSQALMLAAELDVFNQARRAIELGMETEALALCQVMVRDEQTMPFGLAIYHAQ